MVWRDVTSGLLGCLLIAIALAFAMDHIALPFGTDLHFSEESVSISGSNVAFVVDRLGKGDRLIIDPVGTIKNVPLPESRIPLGCDTAFSQLAGLPRENSITRCLAANAAIGARRVAEMSKR